jgi:hypothetical protein
LSDGGTGGPIVYFHAGSFSSSSTRIINVNGGAGVSSAGGEIFALFFGFLFKKKKKKLFLMDFWVKVEQEEL